MCPKRFRPVAQYVSVLGSDNFCVACCSQAFVRAGCFWVFAIATYIHMFTAKATRSVAKAIFGKSLAQLFSAQGSDLHSSYF